MKIKLPTNRNAIHVMLVLCASAVFVVCLTGCCEKREPASVSPDGKSVVFEENTNESTSLLTERDIKILVEAKLGKLKKDGKLVCSTQTIDITVRREESDKVPSEIFGDFKLGESVVLMNIEGNKVQYYIAPDKVSTQVMGSNVLIKCPSPKLDKEFVDVQSHPEKIKIEKNMAWYRTKSGHGEKMADDTRKELRRLLIKAAEEPDNTQQARQHCEEVLEDMLAGIIQEQNKKNSNEFKVEAQCESD